MSHIKHTKVYELIVFLLQFYMNRKIIDRLMIIKKYSTVLECEKMLKPQYESKLA